MPCIPFVIMTGTVISGLAINIKHIHIIFYYHNVMYLPVKCISGILFTGK